jgi:hypothetical protein
MDCAYESIYGLGVGLSMRGAMIVKSNQMISQWWRSNYRYFDWLIGLFFSIRDFNQFSSTFFDYSRSGCVSEVPKLPAYSVACSRSSMESLPPPVSWNSLTSRRPMGKRYLFQNCFVFLVNGTNSWQTKKRTTWKLCRGVCVPRSFNFDTRFQSISGVGRACRVGHVPVFVSLPVVI